MRGWQARFFDRTGGGSMSGMAGSIPDDGLVLIKVADLKIGKGDQLFKIFEMHDPLLEGHQILFAQLAQDTIDMDRA